MGTRSEILKLAKTGKNLRTSELVRHLRLSRQTVADHLKRLVQEGLLTRTGSTRAAVYSLNAAGKPPRPLEVKLVKRLKGLQEDRVFQELERRMDLKHQLSENVRNIAFYSFTEMLNNAIDHSNSKVAYISVRIKNGFWEFQIKDAGIGAFKNVQKTFRLENELEAAEHLFKGKQTTDPKRHSGQGIFFTSRIADRFVLRSHGVDALIDNERDDFLLQDDRPIKGTLVRFRIRQRSKKKLADLFKNFAGEDFEFDRSNVRVRLGAHGEFVSRSQARRLLAGLEQYQQLTFDFKGVRGIGQAFADEIFRVFQARFPKIKVSYENASPAVEFMVSRARK